MAIPTWYSSIQPQIYILVGSEASKQRECSFSSSYIATWTSENVSGHQRFRQPISPDLSHLSKKITFFFSSRKLFFSLTTCREFGTLISKKKLLVWSQISLQRILLFIYHFGKNPRSCATQLCRDAALTPFMSGAGNREAVFPTRMTLGVMKTKLKGAQQGHSLLKRKSEALTKRFRDITKRIDDVSIKHYTT